MAYNARTVPPEPGNPYYNTISNGGYSYAIEGFPTDLQNNVLANCVGYAYGRFNEIGQYGACVYLQPVNAEDFMEYKGDLAVGMTPKLGACMVWSEGEKGYSEDGCGHVAIVEEIYSPTHILTSESAYGGRAFYTTERRLGDDGKWSMGSRFDFLGFIYNPAVPESDQPDFTVPDYENTNFISAAPLTEAVPSVKGQIRHPWMRRLEVELSNDRDKMVFGTEKFTDGNPLNISVDIHKYMSALKDECVIRITNMAYSQIVRLIDNKYFSVTVRAGYENTGVVEMFRGAVLYITNAITDTETRTNEAVILCSSTLVAKYGQSRINLSRTGNLNIYQAIEGLCKEAGIRQYNLAQELKNVKLNQNEIENVSDTPGGWLNRLTTKNGSFVINTDETMGGLFSIYDARRSQSFRNLQIADNALNLSNGYPQITSEGLTLSLLPFYPFVCGDVVTISNYLIQFPQITSREGLNMNASYFLDEKGEYIVYEIDMQLTNRGSNFSQQLLCKSRSLFQNLTGAGAGGNTR